MTQDYQKKKKGADEVKNRSAEQQATDPSSPAATLWEKMKTKTVGFVTGYEAAVDVGEMSKERVRENRALLKKQIAVILGWLAKICAGFLLGRCGIFWGIHPFGLAYLCAVRQGVWFAFAGVMLSTLFLGESTSAYAIASVFALILRYSISRYLAGNTGEGKETGQSKKEKGAAVPASFAGKNVLGKGTLDACIKLLFPPELFGESVLLRSGMGCAAACVAAIGEAMSRSLPVQFILLFLFLFLMVGILTYFFSIRADGARNSTRAELGRLGFLFVLVLSLEAYVVFGFSLQTVVAFLLTLYCSKQGTTLQGCAVGIIIGLAVDPLYAPLFALGGLCAGALWGISSALAILMAMVAGCGWALYIGTFSALRGVVPDIIGACALFYPLSALPIPENRRRENPAEKQRAVACQAITLEQKQAEMMHKLDTLSGVLRSLSETFYSLSDRARRPGMGEVQRTLEETRTPYCSRCPGNDICWGRDAEQTAKGFFDLGTILTRKGKAEEEEIPDFLTQRCRFLKEMIADVNFQIAQLYERKVCRDKTAVFAEDYENMAGMLMAAIAENTEDFERDNVLGTKMQRAMEGLDFYCDDFAVLGRRRKTVVAAGVDLHHQRTGNASLRECMEGIAGVRYDTPQFEVKENSVTMIAKSIPCWQISWGIGQTGKEDEITGDCTNVFQNKSDYFYAMLSDGMGSGKEASVTAQICAMFLEQMLMGGNSKAVTLEMLNHFLRSRQIECTSTVDLAEIDLVCGEAAFVKSGAAPSYVLRQERVYKIASNTVPVGILKGVCAKQTKLTLCDGDMIVLVSDGVIRDDMDSAWLAEILTYELSNDPKVMANRIVRLAADRTGVRDDLSAVVLKVNKAS